MLQVNPVDRCETPPSAQMRERAVLVREAGRPGVWSLRSRRVGFLPRFG